MVKQKARAGWGGRRGRAQVAAADGSPTTKMAQSAAWLVNTVEKSSVPPLPFFPTGASVLSGVGSDAVVYTGATNECALVTRNGKDVTLIELCPQRTATVRVVGVQALTVAGYASVVGRVHVLVIAWAVDSVELEQGGVVLVAVGEPVHRIDTNYAPTSIFSHDNTVYITGGHPGLISLNRTPDGEFVLEAWGPLTVSALTLVPDTAVALKVMPPFVSFHAGGLFLAWRPRTGVPAVFRPPATLDAAGIVDAFPSSMSPADDIEGRRFWYFWVVTREKAILAKLPRSPGDDAEMRGAGPEDTWSIVFEWELGVLGVGGEAVVVVGERNNRVDCLLCTGGEPAGVDGEEVVVGVGFEFVGNAGETVRCKEILSETRVSPFLHAEPCPLSFSLAKAGVRVYQPESVYFLEVIPDTASLLRELTSLDIFITDRRSAMESINVDPDAPDAIYLLLDYLVDNRLTHCIYNWVPQARLDVEEHIAVLRSILSWLTARVAEVRSGVDRCLQAHADGAPWGPERRAEYTAGKKALGQYLVAAEALLSVPETQGEERANEVFLKRLKASLEKTKQQVQHVGWLVNRDPVRAGGDALGKKERSEAVRRLDVLCSRSLNSLAVVAKRMRQADLDEITTAGHPNASGTNRPPAAIPPQAANPERLAAPAAELGAALHKLDATFQRLPPGFLDKLASLNRLPQSEPADPGFRPLGGPVLAWDILQLHATLVLPAGEPAPWESGLLTPQGNLRLAKLFDSAAETAFTAGAKIDLLTPLGAGWTSASVDAHHEDDATLDVRTADGSVHANVPVSEAVLCASKDVINAGVQRLLRQSVFFYYVLCVKGTSEALQYAKYEAGLPMRWTTFLMSLWAIEFGSRVDVARYPLEMISRQDVEGMLQLDPEQASSAINCMFSCATDCAERAALLLWCRLEDDGQLSQFAPSFERYLASCSAVPTASMYKPAGLSPLAIGHLRALCLRNSICQALDLVRGLSAPLGSVVVLNTVLEHGLNVSTFLTYPLAHDEEALVHLYLTKLCELRKSEKAVLSGKLVGVDASAVLLAFLSSRFRYFSLHSRVSAMSASKPGVEGILLKTKQLLPVADADFASSQGARPSFAPALLPSAPLTCAFSDSPSPQ
ncbi:hypothetical protein DIPPA_00542 [Diplonema papillatum]|nr:hypothetical protein DIPPA_00542 [Diplonema papillatum]